MINVKLNYKNYIAILEKIWLRANEWTMLNRIIRVGYQYLKPFSILSMALNYIWWWGSSFEAWGMLSTLLLPLLLVHSKPEWLCPFVSYPWMKDTEPSDGEVRILELWVIWSTTRRERKERRKRTWEGRMIIEDMDIAKKGYL